MEPPGKAGRDSGIVCANYSGMHSVNMYIYVE